MKPCGALMQVCVLFLVISETFEEERCNGAASEEDPETQSTCSFSSNSAPLDVPCPYLPSPSSPYPLLSSSCPFPSSSSPPSPSPSPCPGDLELPEPDSLEGFGLVSPVLGPRSECMMIMHILKSKAGPNGPIYMCFLPHSVYIC